MSDDESELFEGWEMDLRSQLLEREINAEECIDLVKGVLEAFQRDELEVFDDPDTGQVLIVIPNKVLQQSE